MKGVRYAPRRNKHGRKRYKGAAIVDPEIANILEKHNKEEEKRREFKNIDDEWQSLQRKLKEQKRQQREAQRLNDEGMSLTMVFTTCGAVLSLIVMAMILILWGR